MLLEILFACIAAIVLIGIAVLACFYGNGDKELAPVDRFMVAPPLPPPIVPPTHFDPIVLQEEESEEDEEEQPGVEEIKPATTTTALIPITTNSIVLNWNAVKTMRYDLDEHKLDALLYMYHRHVKRAMQLSEFHERETLVAQQNLKQAVHLLLQAALQSVEVQIPVLSNEIRNGFDYFLERHCDVVIREDGHYHTDAFTYTLPFLQEAFSQTEMSSHDALWFTETVSVLKKQLATHTSLSQDVYLFLHMYGRCKLETQIRFPMRVQKILDKRNSRLHFMVEQSIRMHFEQEFTNFLLTSKNKQELYSARRFSYGMLHHPVRAAKVK